MWQPGLVSVAVQHGDSVVLRVLRVKTCVQACRKDESACTAFWAAPELQQLVQHEQHARCQLWAQGAFGFLRMSGLGCAWCAPAACV